MKIKDIREVFPLVQIDKCPYCGSRQLGIGVQDGYAAIRPQGSAFKSANLYHLICSDCGMVLASVANKPELFLPKRED